MIKKREKQKQNQMNVITKSKASGSVLFVSHILRRRLRIGKVFWQTESQQSKDNYYNRNITLFDKIATSENKQIENLQTYLAIFSHEKLQPSD